MKTILVIACVIVLVIGGVFLFVWFGGYDVAADRPDFKAVSWFLEEVRERSIDVRSQSISIPAPANSKRIQSASDFYYGTCAICHGAKGNPPQKFTRAMDPEPPDFTSPSWDIPEERELFWIVKHGIKMTGMASFGKEVFDDDQVWAMVDFLKTHLGGGK